jgi:cell wall assembly regulator SMI1
MLADTLRSIDGLRLTDQKGVAHTITLRPPATDADMAKIEAGAPGPLPADIRDALRVSTGLAEGPLEAFSLVDLEGFGLEEAFPCAWSVAHDGTGNFWILDLLPGAAEWGPVLYACHDPAVIAWQASSLDDFLRDVVALWRPGSKSPVDRVTGEVVHQVWRDQADLIEPAAAAASEDPVLRDFAATLPPAARIADLRQGAVGQGFAWGLFGSRTEIRRAGLARVWALVPPAPRPGLLKRLFGAHTQ